MRLFTLILFFYTALAFAYNPADLESFRSTKRCEFCDLNGLNMSADLLGQDDYTDAILSGSYFYGSSIEHLDLSRLAARELTGMGLLLHDNDLTEGDFSYSDLPRLKVTQFNRGSRVSFKGSTLDYSDFSYTVFEGIDVSGAAMRYALLYHVAWPNGNLSETLLHGADLTFANLRDADLRGAILTSALLNRADLSGANLLGATVTMEQLKKAKTVCGATLPDGSIGGC